MSEVYRKWGRSLRREGARLVRLDEAGEAIEDGRMFRATPIDGGIDLAAPDPESIDAAAREIESAVRPPLLLERLFVSEGNVAHECGGIRWNETVRRVHVAIARPPIRALVDLADFDFDVVRRIARALLRAEAEREAPERIRLAANVGAALLPFANLPKTQSAAPHDGKGGAVREQPAAKGEPPNWFRPSYRLRPRRAWLHLRAHAFGDVETASAEAIALLAPASERLIHVLCVDGNRIYPARVPVTDIVAARPDGAWYPYGAGAFGAELLL